MNPAESSESNGWLNTVVPCAADARNNARAVIDFELGTGKMVTTASLRSRRGDVFLGYTPTCRSVTKLSFRTLCNREDYGRVTDPQGPPHRDGSVQLSSPTRCRYPATSASGLGHLPTEVFPEVLRPAGEADELVVGMSELVDAAHAGKIP